MGFRCLGFRGLGFALVLESGIEGTLLGALVHSTRKHLDSFVPHSLASSLQICS